MSKQMRKKKWVSALRYMRQLADVKVGGKSIWKDGQDDTIRWISSRLAEQTGVLVADEVGMGKTRVAMAAILAVLKNGGTVAAVVPPGLLSQWKKEWTEFLHSLPAGEADLSRYTPIVLRSYHTMFEYPDLRYPLAEKNGRNWLLISHLFGVPRLTAGKYHSTHPDRYMLPILATALRLRNDGENQGNRFRQFIKEYDWHSECVDGVCENCTEHRQRVCQSSIQERKAAEFLSNRRWGKYRNLPDIRDVEKAKEFYNRPAGFEMIGDLLGEIDLLVIDEAHKGRDTDDDQKRLGSLLRNIIRTSERARRMALTATPMELGSEQWKTIFDRISEGSAFPEDAVSNFASALTMARKQPDNRERILELKDCSRAFSFAMRDFVTRRRRTLQAGFINLVGKEYCSVNPHPHRKWDAKRILFNDVSEKWRPAVFAMEALGKAAKGLSTEIGDRELRGLLHKAKLLDSRYAAGQIATKVDLPPAEEKDIKDLESRPDDLSVLSERIEDNLGNADAIDPHSSAKMRRISYWLKRVIRIPDGLDGHPRVQETANLIDRFVWDDEGNLREKVLVFGTYIAPLKALRNVLNRRAVLRLLNRTTADGGIYPLPGAAACLRDINRLKEEYERLRQKGSPGFEALEKRLSSMSMRELVLRAERSYKRQQHWLRLHIDARTFVSTLPGDFAIREARLSSKVAAFLRAEIVNRSLCSGTAIGDDTQETKMRALVIWAEFLSSFLDTEGDEGGAEKTVWTTPPYFQKDRISKNELSSLDRLADNMKSRLAAPLSAELYESSSRFGSFARMLYGEVRMESRHILQAQFNSPFSFPVILIAQSQVGREGLNLHKACRIVVQFHSEWNPGVIEQQIGRVDRIGSLWENRARRWKESNQRSSSIALKEETSKLEYPGPRIEIWPVVFEGTYDSFQYGISKRRRETLSAHLFGELLGGSALEKMPKDGEWVGIRKALASAAPDFSPPTKGC
jgi:hypothetical protein